MLKSDTALIAAALRDEQGFRQLVSLLTPSMKAVARAIVGEALADDVVQEAWLSIYKALPAFERRSSLKTWVVTITANEAKRQLRKESRRVSANRLSNEPVMTSRYDSEGMWSRPPVRWNDDTPEALLTNVELMECIRKIMGQLSDQQQAALILKDIDGLPADEICNILEVSVSNVRVLIHRARHKLFEHINHFQETGQC